MTHRLCLVSFCILFMFTPASAVCYGDVELSPPPGVPTCTGFMDSPPDQPWPRLPTDAEIEAAKEEYLAYVPEVSGRDYRIDAVRVAKYHYCNKGWWHNNVDLEVEWSYLTESDAGAGEWQSLGKDHSYLIYNPGIDRFEFVDTFGPSNYFLGFFGTDAIQGFATGTCSSGGGVPATSSGGSVSPESDDNSWIVIIGAIAIIGGGLAIGAKKLAGGKGEKAPKEKKKKKKEPEKVRYILQLSTDRLKVTPEATAHLKVTAWKIIGESPPAPAPEAAITLTVPAGSEGLVVQPASGTGTVEASIALVSPVAQSPVPITVTASAGKSSVASQVMVEIPAEYLMEFF